MPACVKSTTEGERPASHQLALTYAATIVAGLTMHQADRLDLIRSPTRVLAHTWENGVYNVSSE
jgi:hypothetical protein